MMKGRMKKILFVCTGNSCRSVMAEGLLKKMIKETGGRDIEVYSAGTAAISGFAPTDKTIEVMKRDGIDVSGYKTAKLTPDIIRKADLILTMDNAHKDRVADFVPEAKDKTYLLREYINKKSDILSYAIEDPIGKPLEVYERVFNIIKESIKELMKRL